MWGKGEDREVVGASQTEEGLLHVCFDGVWEGFLPGGVPTRTSINNKQLSLSSGIPVPRATQCM